MAHVLVADDDLRQLELRQLILEAGGHRVSIACCPADAIRKRSEADVIILDLRFPNHLGESDAEQGLALIRELRAEGCTTPLLVLSGWPDDIQGRPEEGMVSRVLMKPVTAAELLSAIAEVA